jgi:hypothetical protein
MEWLAFPLTVFAFFVGIAFCANGFNLVTIHKHYHKKGGDRND